MFSCYDQCIMMILFSSAFCQNLFPTLESIEHHEINKTIQEINSLTTMKAQPLRRPFLPFSNLGAPAGPTKVGKESHETSNDFLNTIHNGIYTTLDKLPYKKKARINLKKLIGENLGGLSPEEVYYIDKDLLIIKGGDFDGKNYVKKKYGQRRKNIKRFRRIKSKKTSPGLKVHAANNRHGKNSSEERENVSALNESSIPTSELALFLPSLQVQNQQKKEASAFHYFVMPAPMNVLWENFHHTPIHAHFSYNSHQYPHQIPYESHINYQENFIYFPHFHKINPLPPKNWLPVPLKIAYSYNGDTNVNYDVPQQYPNPEAEWTALKSKLK